MRRKTVFFQYIERFPRAVEPVGIFPRTIIRALDRFVRQMWQTSNTAVLDEFRISRYQILVCVQTIVTFTFVPMILNMASVKYIIRPLTTYMWNNEQEDIFLNQHFEKQALEELENFESELYFQYVSESPKPDLETEKKGPKLKAWLEELYRSALKMNPSVVGLQTWRSAETAPTTAMSTSSAGDMPNQSAWKPLSPTPDASWPERLGKQLQDEVVVLSDEYNTKSIESLTILFGDMVVFCTIIFLIFRMEAEIIISKSVLLELFFGLNDTQKGVFLIFSSNLLVGFHSPRGWELLLETVFDRYGFPPDQNVIYIFVSSFPVLLDTVFKYWVFRYLNKISPSTVVTYHAMIE